MSSPPGAYQGHSTGYPSVPHATAPVAQQRVATHRLSCSTTPVAVWSGTRWKTRLALAVSGSTPREASWSPPCGRGVADPRAGASGGAGPGEGDHAAGAGAEVGWRAGVDRQLAQGGRHLR